VQAAALYPRRNRASADCLQLLAALFAKAHRFLPVESRSVADEEFLVAMDAAGKYISRHAGAAPSSVAPREDILKWLDAYGIAQDFDTNDGIALIQAWESARASSPSSATEQEHWISVDEKLPAANWYGLFITNENYIELGYFRDDPDEKPCWVCERTAPQDETIKYVNQDGQVTHWRELPKPPSSAGTPEGK
jgi:hypothetical protein